MYVNGTWGGVCGHDPYWNLKDANVVCRQLGFKGAVAAATSSDIPQRKLIPNLKCKGNETSLTKCDHVVAPKGASCSYNRDACVVYITGTTNNRPLSGSKNPHFQIEAKGKIFVVKMNFIHMRMNAKIIFISKAEHLTYLVLKQGPGGTRKWRIIMIQP